MTKKGGILGQLSTKLEVIKEQGQESERHQIFNKNRAKSLHEEPNINPPSDISSEDDPDREYQVGNSPRNRSNLL